MNPDEIQLLIALGEIPPTRFGGPRSYANRFIGELSANPERPLSEREHADLLRLAEKYRVAA